METRFRSETSFPGFKERYSTSSLDSGCSDSFQTSTYVADKKDKQKPVAEHQTFLEQSTENLAKCSPVYSSRTKNEFQHSPLCCSEQDKKGKNVSSGFYETPRPSKKDASLRRRLLMSKAATGGSKDNLTTSVNSRLSFNISSFEESGSNEVIEFPENEHFEALATSTLKTEEPVSSCRKKRFLFSQMRTSTIEEPRSANRQPPVPECLTPVQFGTQNELDESIISSFTHEHLSQELLMTPQSNKFSKPIQDKFITPVSNLAAKFQLNLSVLSTPPVTPIVKLDAAIPEDSGFNTLGLDKSEDSILDHYGSFEELLPHKCKETPKVLEAKRRSWLERLRRLSTLREGGSQSGERVDCNTSVKDLKSLGKVKKEPVAEKDDELFNETTPHNGSVLRLEDLTRTPALQAVHAMCLRSARKAPRHTAVEDLLGLSEGSKPFETTMPLAGLIGRNMGLRELDFLAELKRRNLRHVLSLILNCLSPEDIYRFGQVSEVWNEIVLQDKMKNRIRRSYMKQLKAVAEQGSQTRVPDVETRLNLLSRSALRSVQSQATVLGTPTSGPNGLPFTPTGGSNGKQLASKHDAYLKVARTLFNDESLWPCPRCQCPARCHPVKKQGICSREECAFDFCTYCFCAFHGSKECRSPSTKRRTENEMLPGSAKSKRNLKRL